MHSTIEEIPSVWTDIVTNPHELSGRLVEEDNNGIKNRLKLSAFFSLSRQELFESFSVYALYEQTISSVFCLRDSVESNSLLLSTEELHAPFSPDAIEPKIRCYAPLFELEISCEDIARIRSGTDLALPHFENCTTYIFSNGLPLGRAIFNSVNGKIIGRIEKLFKNSCRIIVDNIFLKDLV